MSRPPGELTERCPYCERSYSKKKNIVSLDLQDLPYTDGFPLTVNISKGVARWHWKAWCRTEIGTSGPFVISQGSSFRFTTLRRRISEDLVGIRSWKKSRFI